MLAPAEAGGDAVIAGISSPHARLLCSEGLKVQILMLTVTVISKEAINQH